MSNHTSRREALNALQTTLKGFIGQEQLTAISDIAKSTDRQAIFDLIGILAHRVERMPVTYGQDGLGDKAIAHLHYFQGGADFYITEKDVENEQLQAFGLVDLGRGPELGYISIVDLIKNNIEIDLHYEPQTLADIKLQRVRHSYQAPAP